MNLSRILFFIVFLGSLGGVGSMKAHADSEHLQKAARKAVEKYQDSIVTVKFIVKIRQNGKEREQETEYVGTIIDPTGLTLVPSTAIDYTGLNTLINSVASDRGVNMPDTASVSSDIVKVLMMFTEGKDIEADVVIKDTDLGVAVIRPRENRVFKSIPLKERNRPLELLDEYFVLSRQGANYHRSLWVFLGAIQSIVSGPPTYYTCSATAPGSLAFAEDGLPLGVFTSRWEQADPSRKSFSIKVTAVLRSIDDILDLVEQAKAAKPVSKKSSSESPVPSETKSEATPSPDSSNSN